MKSWHWLALAVVGLALLMGGAAAGGGVSVVREAIATLTGRKRGSKPVVAFTKGADGRVVESIADLAESAGRVLGRDVGADEFVLATEISSEEGGAAVPVKVAVANATVNYARRKGATLQEVLASDGALAGQNVPGHGYASTARPPHADDFDVARAVLGGDEPDNTAGSIQFDSPAGQRASVARHIKGYAKGPEEVAEIRHKEGKEEYHLPGIDPDKFRLWRYVG